MVLSSETIKVSSLVPIDKNCFRHVVECLFRDADKSPNDPGGPKICQNLRVCVALRRDRCNFGVDLIPDDARIDEVSDGDL